MFPHETVCGKELRINLFDAAKRATDEISQEADLFEKARKKRRPIAWGDYTFASDR